MRVLVTGSQGYIGSVLLPILNKKYNVYGLDIGYYEKNSLDSNTKEISSIKKDIRDITLKDIQDFDVIVHLAGLSNDPLGEFSPKLTKEINYEATINLAKLAKKAKVSKFIFSSSQSMYGISNTGDELDEDNSEKRPVTQYAKSKWEAEKFILDLNDDNFCVTCFRPSTVFGVSNRLRCDVVFNNLVACAYTTGKIEIKSDGTPWRPIVHVQDVCLALIAGIEAPKSIVSKQSYNVGILNGNYRIKDLAEAAQKTVPGSKLIFTNEHNDPRTYKVSFKKILNELKDFYKPQWDLEKGGSELVTFFKKINFTENDFRSRNTIRLEQLLYLKSKNQIDDNLRFCK